MKRLLVACVVIAVVAACGGDAQSSRGPVAVRTSAPVAATSAGGPTTVTPTTGVVAGRTPSSVPLATTGPVRTPAPVVLPTPDFPQLTAPPTPVGQGTLGAPSWVQPGTRITFYDAAASVAQSRFEWVEDPNGNWTDPRTGTKYRRTDETGQGVSTASGDGLSQLDIVAIEGTDVIGSNALYGIDRANNQFAVLPGSGFRAAGSVVDGAWINPDLLAQLQTQNVGGLLVLRGPYPLGNATYDALSFVNPTQGAYSSYTYDTATGLLLSATTSTAGATSPLSAPNEPPPQGNTQLTITRLAGARQRTVLGLNGTNPEWVARTSRLDYSGTYNFTNPVDPSSANITFPMTSSVTLTPGGTNWAAFRIDSLIQMPGGQPSQSTGVTSTAGVYWVDPQALAGLTAGQILDQDPITHERDTVLSVDRGQNGPTVTTDSQLSGIESQTTYDLATGVLLQIAVFQASSGATFRLSLQQMP